METIIYNALISKETNGWVAVKDGRITALGTGHGYLNHLTPETEKVDADGCYLLPGAIDCHVHMREPGMTHKATMASETRAAVAGGVTSVIDMPNTIPPATTNVEIAHKQKIARQSAVVNHAFFIGAARSNARELLEADYTRIPGIKLFMGSSTGNMLVEDKDELERIFRDATAPICVHAEDNAVISLSAAKVRAGYPEGSEISVAHHTEIRPVEACVKATRRALELAMKYNTRLHIAHVTTAKEVELIHQAKEQGVRVTCEVSPHHLLFCEDDYATLGARIKMNPAVKSAAHREALRKALTDGKIDMVATDHAPHLLSEKDGDAFHAVSGAPMVQFAYPVLCELFSPELAAEYYASRPAQVFGIKDRGKIAVGMCADLVLMRHIPGGYIVSDADVVSLCGWTPLNGRTLHYKVERVWVNGGNPSTITAMPLEFNR